MTPDLDNVADDGPGSGDAVPRTPPGYAADAADRAVIFAHDEDVLVDVPLTGASGRGAAKRRIVVRRGAIASALGIPAAEAAARLSDRTAENWVRIHLQRVFEAEAAKRARTSPTADLVILDRGEI